MTQGMFWTRVMVSKVPHRSIFNQSLLALGVMCAAMIGRVDAGVLPISPGSWSLAILPDTQGYVQTPGSAPIFDAQTQFLADNAAALNLKYVLHEGDVTEHNVPVEWDNALEAMNRLNGVVPYAMVTGNHDVGPNGSPATRDSYFDNPAYFGPGSYYATQPSVGGFYPPGKTANSWHTFSNGDSEWLVVALEWSPSDADLAWANSVISSHPSDRTIVLTHAYLYSDNTRYDWAKYGAGQYGNPHNVGFVPLGSRDTWASKTPMTAKIFGTSLFARTTISISFSTVTCLARVPDIAAILAMGGMLFISCWLTRKMIQAARATCGCSNSTWMAA